MQHVNSANYGVALSALWIFTKPTILADEIIPWVTASTHGISRDYEYLVPSPGLAREEFNEYVHSTSNLSSREIPTDGFQSSDMIAFRTSPLSVFISLACLVVLTVLLFMLTGCDTAPRPEQQSDETSSSLEIDDIRIPIFSTSQEQFNYTRSWFAESKKKRAALQAYIQLYPEQRRNCGLAALDLAYLQLGSDYRFAHEKAYFAALASYNSILEEFVDYPPIMAKALWYTGWISMDLLYDRQRGLEAYRQVVRKYPLEPVSLLPPAPWVSIIYPQDDLENAAATQPSGRRWAALALVEIIKHTEDAEAGWQAFLQLWQEYPEDVATGFGLRVVLRRRYHVDEVLPMARRFMDSNLSNIHLLSDIRKEMKAISSAEGVSSEGALQHED